jgi:hypothetical protein
MASRAAKAPEADWLQLSPLALEVGALGGR